MRRNFYSEWISSYPRFRVLKIKSYKVVINTPRAKRFLALKKTIFIWKQSDILKSINTWLCLDGSKQNPHLFNCIFKLWCLSLRNIFLIFSMCSIIYYLVTINFTLKRNFIVYNRTILMTSDAVNTLNKNKIFRVFFEKAFIHGVW